MLNYQKEHTLLFMDVKCPREHTCVSVKYNRNERVNVNGVTRRKTLAENRGH